MGIVEVPMTVKTVIDGVNTVLKDMGFPLWTLVKWDVQPLFTLLLVFMLLIGGLRSFAATQLLFSLWKLVEEYGESAIEWLSGSEASNKGSVPAGRIPRPRSPRTVSRSSRTESKSPVRTKSPTKSP